MTKQFLVNGALAPAFHDDLDKAVKAAQTVIAITGKLDKAKATFRASVLSLASEWGLTATDIHSGYGKGNTKGIAYDAVHDATARMILTEAQYALATDDSPTFKTVKGKRVYLPKHGLLNRVTNVINDVRKELAEPTKTERTKKTALDTDRDAIAKRISVIQNAIKADTDARKNTLAEYGGESEAKRLLAAWDVLNAEYK